MKNINISFSSGFYWATYVFAFSLSLSDPLSKLTIFLWLLIAVFSLKSGYKELLANLPLVFVVSSFYFVWLLSLFYTQNLYSGWYNSMVKVSFLILPLLFSLHIEKLKQKMKPILVAFVLGLIFASLICLGYQFILKWQNLPYCFYYIELSILMKPAYFSMYLSMGILIIIYFLKQGIKSNLLKMGYWLTILFFLIMQWLISSRGPMLVGFVVCFFAFLSLSTSKKAFIRNLITMIIIALGFVFLLLKNDRIVFMMEQLKKKDLEVKDTRPEIWKGAWYVVQENFLLGVGSGDNQQMLDKSYKEHGLNISYEKRLNAHNEYLETWMATGIVGVLVLLFQWFYLIKRNYGKQYSYLSLGFVGLVFGNFWFESMLKSQEGVLFYTFFLTLFLFQNTSLDSGNVISKK